MSQRAIGKRAQSAKRKPRKIRGQGVAALPVFRPNTAGIDIGAMEIFVAVSPDLDAEPVRVSARSPGTWRRLPGGWKPVG